MPSFTSFTLQTIKGEQLMLLQIDESTTLSDFAAKAEEGLSEIANLPTSLSETDEYIKNLISLLQEFAVTYGGKLICAIVILIVGFKLSNALTRRLSSSKAFGKMEVSTRGLIKNVTNGGLKIIIAVTALSVLGVPMTSMVAVITSCGLAVGLALQGSLSNIAGGFILLLLKPFAVGDSIVSGAVSGTVENIGIFHTKIISPDNTITVIPNSSISNATLTNVSALKQRRVDLTFTTSSDTDIKDVEKLLSDVCENHPLVLSSPEPFARFSSHKADTFEFTVQVWCKTEDYQTVYFDLLRDTEIALKKMPVIV